MRLHTEDPRPVGQGNYLILCAANIPNWDHI